MSVAAAVVALTAGCSAEPSGRTPTGPPAASPSATPIRVAVVGDSNTTGLHRTLELGLRAGTSWAGQLTPPQFDLVGGWAHDGASTTLMAKEVVPLPDIDVLVVMAGTNDPPQGVSTSQMAADIRGIVTTVEPRAVVISSIPPIQADPARGQRLNRELRLIARQSGWQFDDPWAALRTPASKWDPGYLRDGLHTTASGYAMVGRALRAPVRMAGGSVDPNNADG